MTQEERIQHNNDISNKIIPHLLEGGIETKLGELSIQDLIVIQKNARYALENKMFHMDEKQSLKFHQMIEFIYSMIIDKVKSADKLYLFIDQATKMPYLDTERYIYLFSEQEFAENALDYFRQQQRIWKIEELHKDDIVKTLGQAFYMNGALGVLIDNGQTYISFKAPELIQAPDFSNTHPMDIPVTNPGYLAALASLVQEKSWQVNYPEKGEHLRFFENQMIVEFCNARFLVPVKGMPKPGSEHEVELKEGTKISIPSLSNEKNSATPVFTDWIQFNKVYSQDEWGGWIWKAEDLLSAPEDTVVVNAGEICFAMSKKMIQQIFEIYNKEILPSININRAIKELNEGKLYYTPFVYENEEAPAEEDNSIHYTDESASKVFAEKIGTELEMHHETDKIMHYIKIKNQQSQKEYLAMFSNVDSLRKIFPSNMARICLVGKDFVEKFAWEAEGIVVDLGATITNDVLRNNGFQLSR